MKNRPICLYSVPVVLAIWAIFIWVVKDPHTSIWLLVIAAASIVQIQALVRHYKNGNQKATWRRR